MSTGSGLTRRGFLRVLAAAGGALVVGIPARAWAQQDGREDLAILGDSWTALNAFVRVEPNGRVIIGARTPDMGQGTRTSLPRIIADEMDADWAQVTVTPLPLGVEDDHGAPRWLYGPQNAGGSTSIPNAWRDLRQAGAAARWLLVQAAAARTGLPPDQLRTEAGWVITPDARRLGYGELAADAGKLSLPDAGVALKSPQAYRLIGQAARGVDVLAIVTGTQKFGYDHYWGDGLIAMIVRCPYFDGELDHFDASAALAIDGVEKVLPLPTMPAGTLLGHGPLAAGVAVLARDTWSALKGRAALDVRWKPRDGADASTTALERQANHALRGAATATVRHDGDFAHAFRSAARRIEARYVVPFVAHATMEPQNCLVRIDPDRAYLMAATQTPRSAFEIVRQITGLGPGQIRIEMPRIGGGFGRRLDNDYVAEAVLLAKAVGKPIKLQWTREDDLGHDVYRPFGVHALAAGVDRQGHIVAWRQQLASTSKLWRRGVPADRLWTSELYPDDPPAGMVPNLDLAWFALDFPLPRGNWRAPGHTANAFAVQSFLDEIAHATRQDPLKLRLALLGAPRLLPYSSHGGPTLDTGRLANVLQLAAQRIGWSSRPPAGRGRGLACHFTFGGYVAHAFEVSVSGGKLAIHRAIAAADVGRVIDPNGVDAQISGGTLDALSTALNLAITVRDGAVVQQNFPDYPLARMGEMPREVEVIQVPSQADPAGAGEMGVPSAAPALANAIFAATGVRLRRMPFKPEIARIG